MLFLAVKQIFIYFAFPTVVRHIYCYLCGNEKTMQKKNTDYSFDYYANIQNE